MSSRERLVDTMGELMWERGYADTSPREVRQRAGVGQGSMYHHFATKRDLALAALERNVQDLLPAAAELDGTDGSPMARIEAYLMRPRDALKGCKVGRMTQDPQVREDPALLAPVSRAFADVHVRWVDALRGRRAPGRPGRGAPGPHADGGAAGRLRAGDRAAGPGTVRRRTRRSDRSAPRSGTSHTPEDEMRKRQS
jgi:AcrR family transcriptional regulator